MTNPTPRPANATPAPPAAELTELHHARGLTMRQMCDVYGVGMGVLRRWFDEREVPRLPSGKRPADLATPERRRPSKAELIEMNKTMSQKAIARKLGFGHSTVNMWFREEGIAARVGTRAKVDIASAEYEFLPDAPDTYTPDPTPVPPPRTGKSKAGRSKERITKWQGHVLTVRKPVAEVARASISPDLQANPVPVYPKESYSADARLRASVMVDELRLQFQMRRATGREARI